MNETPAVVDEAEAGCRVMDEWLRLDAQHTDPGFWLPPQAQVVAWCESHAGAILLSANVVLWAPILWAMWQS